MTHWIKLYTEVLYDPKMGMLPEHLRLRAIELFLLAGKVGQNGILPPLDDMAWTLRCTEAKLIKDLHALAQVEIVDQRESGWHVTHFAGRQAPSDSAERMRKWRSRRNQTQDRNITCDVTCDNPGEPRDAPESESESETESETESDTEGEREGEGERVSDAGQENAPPPQKSTGDIIYYQKQPVIDYRRLTGLDPTSLQAQMIATAAMNDPPLWRETIEHWLMHGWKPGNVSGMLDLYRKGGPQACACRRAPLTAPPMRNLGLLAAERARIEAKKNANRRRDPGSA